MRIGIVVEKFPSISETFIYNKVEGLCKRGHQVVVFRNVKHVDEKLEQVFKLKELPNLQLVDVVLPTNKVELARKLVMRPSLAMRAITAPGSGLKKKMLGVNRNAYFKKNPCDIYHFEFSGLALSYLPTIKQLPGKTVVSCRGTAEKVKPISQPTRVDELNELFEAVDKIHCVSQDMADTISAYGAPAAKIFINRPAIHTNYFTSKPEAHKAEKLSIVSVGRLTFQKGYLIGLLAIKELVKKHPAIHYTIVGDGPLKEEIQFYIHDMGLTGYVTLAGAKTRSQVLELMSNADIFFLPSVYEGIANVVLEAMAMELPVVCSDCSGMSEVIVHADNGFLADNYNYLQMAEQLATLCNDKELRQQLGTAARKTVEQHFDVERQLDVFEEQYKQLLTH